MKLIATAVVSAAAAVGLSPATPRVTIPGFVKNQPIVTGCILVQRAGKDPALVHIRGDRWTLSECVLDHFEPRGQMTEYGFTYR